MNINMKPILVGCLLALIFLASPAQAKGAADTVTFPSGGLESW